VYIAPLALHPRPRRVRPESPSRQDRPVVVHAPSDPKFKGTELIRRAVDEIGRRVSLDFRLVRGVTYDAVEAELEKADVVIDQLNSVNVGIVALEAMRAGRAVVSQLDPQALAPYQAGLPVVAATPETLANELETLLRDPELRQTLGEDGRRYVAATHAPAHGAASMIQVYRHAHTDAQGLFEANPHGVRQLPDEERAVQERLATYSSRSP
jgi:glycosyltransferase involved in cell wall biosynthesis